MRVRRAEVHARAVVRASRVAVIGASCALLLPGCGVDVQNGAGPRVPRSGLRVELRNEGGERISSTVTGASGAYGFSVTGSGPWEIKVAAGVAGDFDSITRSFWLQGSGPTELPPLDVYAYGSGLRDPAAGASVTAPSPTQPLTFTWTRPALDGVTARVQLFDSGGVSIWNSSWLDADQVGWNGIGNQGGYQGRSVQAGHYSWRVKFNLGDSSEGRTPTRKLELT